MPHICPFARNIVRFFAFIPEKSEVITKKVWQKALSTKMVVVLVFWHDVNILLFIVPFTHSVGVGFCLQEYRTVELIAHRVYC